MLTIKVVFCVENVNQDTVLCWLRQTVNCALIFTLILLLIPFALAGILLVDLILVLNITIATGNIHGLIFYANIVAANREIFFPTF